MDERMCFDNGSEHFWKSLVIELENKKNLYFAQKVINLSSFKSFGLMQEIKRVLILIALKMFNLTTQFFLKF